MRPRLRKRVVGAVAAVLAAAMATTALAGITFQFDYTYDSEGFFDPVTHAERRFVLEYAAETINRFCDDLQAISPTFMRSWQATFWQPDTGELTTLANLTIPADTLRIYVGARDMEVALAEGGPGGVSVFGMPSWVTQVKTRGESGALAVPATDFGPWGGSVAFDSSPSVPWYFGIDPAGLKSGWVDFYSVVIHELGHVLGFGISDSWDAFVDDQRFTGPAAMAVYGGQSVPLDAATAHWAEGARSTVDGVSQEAAMDPTLTVGTRKRYTDLDFAALQDIGWEVASGRAVWSGAADTQWHNAGNWSTGLAPSAAFTVALEAASARQPELFRDSRVARVDFTTAGWTVGGSYTLAVALGGVDSAGAGTNTVAAGVEMLTNSTWTIGTGNTLVLALPLAGGGRTLTKDGSGVLALAGAAGLKALDLRKGKVALSGGGVLATQGLTITAGGPALDLADGSLILDYLPGASPLVQVTGWVRTGFSGGAGGWWDGPGIQSSAAAGDPNHSTALGVLDNADPLLGGRTEFGGQAVDADCVLVTYAWWGDIDFDGQVTLTDYSIFLYYFFEQESMTPQEMGWWSADLDYDGHVTLTDYNLLLFGFLSQTGPLSGGTPVPVPEPATLALLVLGGLAFLGRRSRQRFSGRRPGP